MLKNTEGLDTISTNVFRQNIHPYICGTHCYRYPDATNCLRIRQYISRMIMIDLYFFGGAQWTRYPFEGYVHGGHMNG